MSYVHEGKTDKAVAEIQKEAAMAQASNDLVTLSGDLRQIADIQLEAGLVELARAKYQESLAAIDKADVAADVKAGVHRQDIFDGARVALVNGDTAGAKARAAEYAKAVAAKSVPFEVRQTHELSGRIALAGKDYATAVAELQQANKQDPRVLYVLATALQAKGDAAQAKTIAVQAADFNALSTTYGYVRGKAKAMVLAAK